MWIVERSVQRGWLDACSKFLDFVFEKQLLALHFDQTKIVGCWAKLFRLDLSLEGFVTALEFGEMIMHRHRAIPFENADDRQSVTQNSAAASAKNPYFMRRSSIFSTPVCALKKSWYRQWFECAAPHFLHGETCEPRVAGA